ncbi:uncharacterized protein (DUF305 family) [Kineococcus xinjiangensis]|uniref:Uncharacterized protein (DUF305 family) n=1 Tax=Kineococcus xinjiangensis TaxID=512762 RepID=A0A2S6IK15_9ACTN|nr:DUF305 domain-containing protein [Kineococcus xinjiangensis]PPK94549.1 uncharacterized protein (DUF305 family) [Kineococcus xinjiangensis]
MPRTPTRRALTVLAAATLTAGVGAGAAYAGHRSDAEAASPSPSMMDRPMMDRPMMDRPMMDRPMMDRPMMGGDGHPRMGAFSAEQPFDAQFLDQMSVHHRGALMSTEAMIADSARPELRELAAGMLTSQRAQLDRMLSWRGEWYPDLPPTFPTGEGMMDRPMMGGSMMGKRMMGGSADAEAMYLRMMVAHHRLGVEMAEEAQRRATHPRLRELAASMGAERAAEIEVMESHLAGATAPGRS